MTSEEIVKLLQRVIPYVNHFGNPPLVADLKEAIKSLKEKDEHKVLPS